MNISIITASFPLDQQTYEEVGELLQTAYEADGKHYEEVVKYALMPSYDVKGFVVIAYDDTTDKVVAIASAADIIGFNTYEWSALVAPMYRSVGIGSFVIEALREGLAQRNCEGELALVVKGEGKEQRFLQRLGYYYSFSEAILESPAVAAMPNYDMREYYNEQQDIAAIYAEAFGDLSEEATELIAYSTEADGCKLWVAYEGDEVVGTITTTRQGNVQWITALATKATARGKGVASAMLAWAKYYTLHEGGTKVMIEVEMENEEALRVYKKNHFLLSQQTDYYVRKLG